MKSRRLNILSVDDMSGIRYLLDAIVKEAGHKSYSASNGFEALEVLKTEEIDLVFLDIKLPGINGFAVMERIKDLDIAPIIVGMTGYSEQQIMDQVFNGGAARCIVKPFNVDEIRMIIRETEADQQTTLNS